ncbi:MAG: putative DNA binding domain-containing protein [bacterium]|nr:putative DNA binding domain-containing protein [bacterium]
MPHYRAQSHSIRRSPAVFVKTIIATELGALALFLAARPVAFYKELYNEYVYRTLLPIQYDAVFMAAVTLFEVFVTVYVFLRWYSESYRIDTHEILHEHGTLLRRQTRVPLSRVSSIRFRLGFMGSFFQYGTVKLQLESPTATAELKDLPQPKKYAGIITDFARQVKRDAPSSKDSLDIEEVLRAKEHEGIEFKASLRWDRRLLRVNRELEKSVMKTIAAFLNSDGGHLVIGVEDGGEILGLGNDYETIQRKDSDGFENHFTQVFRSMIGSEFRRFAHLHFHEKDGKDICIVRVLPSTKPAYLALDNREEFFIRTGNTTSSLNFSEAHAYIRSRWGEI